MPPFTPNVAALIHHRCVEVTAIEASDGDVLKIITNMDKMSSIFNGAVAWARDAIVAARVCRDWHGRDDEVIAGTSWKRPGVPQEVPMAIIPDEVIPFDHDAARRARERGEEARIKEPIAPPPDPCPRRMPPPPDSLFGMLYDVMPITVQASSPEEALKLAESMYGGRLPRGSFAMAAQPETHSNVNNSIPVTGRNLDDPGPSAPVEVAGITGQAYDHAGATVGIPGRGEHADDAGLPDPPGGVDPVPSGPVLAVPLGTVIAEAVLRTFTAAYPDRTVEIKYKNGDIETVSYGRLSDIQLELSRATAAALGSSAEMGRYLALNPSAAFELNGPRVGRYPVHRYNVPSYLHGVFVKLDDSVPAGVFRFRHLFVLRDPPVEPVLATWAGFRDAVESMRIPT